MAIIAKNYLQLDFIEKIRQSIPSEYSLVDELCDVLDISMDSSYRRIRGDTLLTIDEIVKLCNHYNISFDSFCSNSSGAVTFNYKSCLDYEKQLLEYLDNILNVLEKIYKAEKKQIIYTAEDFTLFHILRFEELYSFKFFYWMRSVMNVSEMQNKSFNFSLISDEIKEKSKKIFDLYARVPSIEIWTEDTINSFLKQIEYYWESGIFENNNDVLLICDQLSETLDFIKKQAEKGHKCTADEKKVAGDNNFVLYCSEMEISSNCIHTTIGDIKTVYLTHFSFNLLSTSNNQFCAETEHWLENLMKKSILISSVSEKQRYQFFNNAKMKIKRLKDRIE